MLVSKSKLSHSNHCTNKQKTRKRSRREKEKKRKREEKKRKKKEVEKKKKAKDHPGGQAPLLLKRN